MNNDEEFAKIIAELRAMVQKLDVPPSLKRPAESLIDQYAVVIDDTLHPLCVTLDVLINGLEAEAISWNNGDCSDWAAGRLYGYLGALSHMVSFTGRHAVKREVE